MTHVHQGHFTSYDLEFTLNTRRLTQWLLVTAGVVKAIVSFYRIDSDTVFERQRSRMPINDVITVHALKNHPVSFLGLKELASKYGLGDFDIRVYRMARSRVGKATTSPSPQTTSGSWNYQACWMKQEAK